MIACPANEGTSVSVPRSGPPTKQRSVDNIRVTLLTGGSDRPYALGLSAALGAQGVCLDFVGSDDLDLPEIRNAPWISFLNLRGDQRNEANSAQKALRILAYYCRLLRYTAAKSPRIFHILWNNKFELFDRTLLMLYYRALGKRIVITAHNVNSGKRDARDTFLNRMSLRAQYRLAHHIFVHTERMKRQLVDEFGPSETKVSVIPFGINNTVPQTACTRNAARTLLGIGSDDKVMLFFGHIAPYKGLDYLILALKELLRADLYYRVIIAGSARSCPEYWQRVQAEILRSGVGERVVQRIEFVPDAETEIYFKAADVSVLPYTDIFQSGVLVLAYSFGLPVIAADVGSLREDIVEGRTGYVFRPKDVADLAATIRRYFSSPLYAKLEDRRQDIRDYAHEKYSWSRVGEITKGVYQSLNDGAG